jgi:hypothetical protein
MEKITRSLRPKLSAARKFWNETVGFSPVLLSFVPKVLKFVIQDFLYTSRIRVHDY